MRSVVVSSPNKKGTRVYFPVAQACDEPSSETPMSSGAISTQDGFVNAMGNDFLVGNQSVYDLVLALGGNLPGLVAGAPASIPGETPVSSTAAVPTSGAGGTPTPVTPAMAAAPVYAAPGVLAGPTGPLVPGPLNQAIPRGIDLGPAVASMVLGCNVPWAGPSLGAQSGSAPGAAQPSGLVLWGLAGLAALAWWLGSEGALR